MAAQFKLLISGTTLAMQLLLGGCGGGSGGLTPRIVNDGNPALSNSPPRISGSPAQSVVVGQKYSFVPQASDPDGDTLVFSVQNLPPWADFDPTNGEISGTPTLGDIGISEDISVSVSDGQVSASISPFDVSVLQAAAGSVALSWTPPAFNDDGSALTDLAGFIIYYGTSPGTYPNEIRIDNPSISSYVVEDLAPDTYYVVVTAFNSSGVVSEFSNEASTQIL